MMAAKKKQIDAEAVANYYNAAITKLKTQYDILHANGGKAAALKEVETRINHLESLRAAPIQAFLQANLYKQTKSMFDSLLEDESRLKQEFLKELLELEAIANRLQSTIRKAKRKRQTSR